MKANKAQRSVILLLAAITEHVELAYQGSKSKGDLDNFWTLELEHILPDTPKKKLRKSWDEANPGCDYDEFKERLGNFILLEKPINVVVGLVKQVWTSGDA